MRDAFVHFMIARVGLKLSGNVENVEKGILKFKIENSWMLRPAVASQIGKDLRRSDDNGERIVSFTSQTDSLPTIDYLLLSVIHTLFKARMATQGNSGSASGGQLEEKIDFSKETDQAVQQCQSLVQAGALQEALQLLSALEKRCRTGNDNASLARVCETAVRSCKEAGDDEAVLQTLTSFSTKRSQKMAAIKALVSTALPWCIVDTYTPTAVSNEAEKSVRDKLVATLRDISDGKLFLERERAQLTRALATIKVRIIVNA
jgi:hypothetical protein